jgi:hypothetical protein
MEYLIQEGLLFKGSELCILKCSMRDNLLKEKHNGGLVGHFSHDKIYVQLIYSYHWLGMISDVKRLMDRCRIFQYEKGKQQNIVLYQPLPIPGRPWDAISMEFVMGLPRTHKGSDFISIVVDIFSKM